MSFITNWITSLFEKLYLNKLLAKLQGWKTYIAIGLFILANSQDALGALNQLIDGQITIVQFLAAIKLVIAAIAGAFAKAGQNRLEAKLDTLPAAKP